MQPGASMFCFCKSSCPPSGVHCAARRIACAWPGTDRGAKKNFVLGHIVFSLTSGSFTKLSWRPGKPERTVSSSWPLLAGLGEGFPPACAWKQFRTGYQHERIVLCATGATTSFGIIRRVSLGRLKRPYDVTMGESRKLVHKPRLCDQVEDEYYRSHERQGVFGVSWLVLTGAFERERHNVVGCRGTLRQEMVPMRTDLAAATPSPLTFSPWSIYLASKMFSLTDRR